MNPYDVLGVSPNASDDEVAKAYKHLAKKYHPDLNPGNTAAADKMGEINRAYADVKAMRQRGESYHTYYNNRNYGSANPGQPAYENPFDPFYTARRTYTTYHDYYRRPKRSPMAAILAVVMMIFFVRLILSLLFGGYANYYTPPNVPGGYPPGYGYYQTSP